MNNATVVSGELSSSSNLTIASPINDVPLMTTAGMYNLNKLYLIHLHLIVIIKTFKYSYNVLSTLQCSYLNKTTLLQAYF